MQGIQPGKVACHCPCGSSLSILLPIRKAFVLSGVSSFQHHRPVVPISSIELSPAGSMMPIPSLPVRGAAEPGSGADHGARRLTAEITCFEINGRAGWRLYQHHIARTGARRSAIPGLQKAGRGADCRRGHRISGPGRAGDATVMTRLMKALTRPGSRRWPAGSPWRHGRERRVAAARA